MPEIRVVLADDHPVVLAGVKALVQASPDILLVGEATDAKSAQALILQLAPDIAVLDVSMPGMSGIDLTLSVAETVPKVKVVVLTVHEDRAYVQQLIKAGARGYLLKRSAAEDLVRAIRAVAAGGIYLDPAVAEKMLEPELDDSPPAPEADLSPREADVLRLTAQGFSNKQIAGQIGVSVKTVETYKARAVEKLGLRSRADIVRFGATCGWLDQLGSA